jgi:hypothetical protein
VPPPPRLLSCLLLFAALAAAGCGDDAKKPAPAGTSSSPPSASWSDTAVPKGSPDGEARVRSPAEVLRSLEERVASGRGLGDPGYEHDVQAVAAVLWDPNAVGADAAAAQVHVQVASIALEVGTWLHAFPGARAEREKSNREDVHLHDAFLKAIHQGPDAYRAWCAGAGAALLRELAAARRRRFFPPR